MENSIKTAIVAELKVRIRKGESQNSLALRCGVSSATISQIVNDNWSLISDKLWNHVKNALKIDFSWNHAETTNFKMLMSLLQSCKQRSMCIGISHDAGAGKSHAYKLFERSEENVFYLECKTFWTRKVYMKNLLKNLGLADTGSIDEMMERMTDHLEGLENPTVIIDQLDKLNDSSLDLYMDFVNALGGHCSFIVSGVPALKKRILRGCQHDKTGYKEFYSRIGKNFIYLDPVSLKDVTSICNANGVTDEGKINEIFNTCDGDLRRVRRDVEKYFLTRKSVA